MAGRLEGKIAFVTGAGRGQGRSHAVRLAEEGADVIAVDALASYDTVPYAMASQADLDETVRCVEKFDRRIVARQVDVRDREALAAAVADGVAQLGGRLDVVAANAGICPPGGPLWELTSRGWDDVIAVNLTGVFHTLAVSIPLMLAAGNGGSIVVTSSGAGLRNPAGLADYNASKHGVIGLALTAANELASRGIRVNAICPGTVGTPMVTANEGTWKLFRPDLESPTLEDAKPAFARVMPMGKPWVDPVDVSNALVWLASDEARYVTGIVVPVDQGSQNK
ncbi:mycofactocin-coupled SDR family oxidoreductase [Frankia sp. Cr2]|uniref:mycofactocin-coupled SDR family oxidoreductase n=1 Tax=Frankia sp. Cr2 TaxID=3073932 RepID=UPI002AD501AB|nr:mycofactocin-coupled SDR family oxidoreductase [Frankia sp. Cr2]